MNENVNKQEKIEIIPNGSIENNQSSLITVYDSIQEEQVSYYLQDHDWLMGRHIDCAMDFIEKKAFDFGNSNLYILNNWKIEDCVRNHGFLQETSELNKIMVVNVNNLRQITT